MQQERVVEDILVFTSDQYVQVTAGVVFTTEGAVVIDTLPFPSETRVMRSVIRRRSPQGVRYVINTHYHPDHVYGTCFFPEAEVVAHRRCRRYLMQYGKRNLYEAQEQVPELADVQIRLPELLVDEGKLELYVGDKILTIFPAPGHTRDGIAVYVKTERVLFAGDVLTPVPSIVGGNIDEMRATLERLRNLPVDNIVQGHGEVLLRGEVAEAIDSNLSYLDRIEERVRQVVEAGDPPEVLRRFGVERCGKSSIALGGMAEMVHQANLVYLYRQMTGQAG